MAPPIALDVEGITDISGKTFPDPLTINDVSKKRAQESKLVAGVAAYTSADLFKIKVCSGIKLF